MISSARQAIACILLLWPTIIFAQSQTASDKESNGSVSGKVTVKGDAVSGVVVGLISMEQRLQRPTPLKATTDEEGKYLIKNVRPGPYELTVSSLTYVAKASGATRKALILGKGETLENIDFDLVRGGVITGKVTDSEGRPVIEVNVSVSSEHSDHPSSVRPSLRTDDRGIYRAYGLPPGSYRVSAGLEENSTFGYPGAGFEHRLTYHPATSDRTQAPIIDVTEGSETSAIDITLGRPLLRYTASGRIVDAETGKPLAGMRYGIFKFINQNTFGSRTGGWATNEQGEFKLLNLSPGIYAVTAEYERDIDFRLEPLRFEIIDQHVSGLIGKASKGASVSGVVVFEGAELKAPANSNRGYVTVFVSSPNPIRESNRSTPINPDGTFRIGGLPDSQVSLWFSSSDNVVLVRVERDGVVYADGIDVKEREQVTGVRLVVSQASGMMRGLVKLANGSPPPERRINVTLKRLTDDAPRLATSGVQVDTRGHFIANRLLPGTYEVTAAIYPLTPTGNNSSLMQRATKQVVVTNGNVSEVTLTLPEP